MLSLYLPCCGILLQLFLFLDPEWHISWHQFFSKLTAGLLSEIAVSSCTCTLFPPVWPVSAFRMWILTTLLHILPDVLWYRVAWMCFTSISLLPLGFCSHVWLCWLRFSYLTYCCLAYAFVVVLRKTHKAFYSLLLEVYCLFFVSWHCCSSMNFCCCFWRNLRAIGFFFQIWEAIWPYFASWLCCLWTFLLFLAKPKRTLACALTVRS